MAKGYIQLHRSLQDNILWQEKPFSKGQAWVDMLLMANHCNNDILLGNEVLHIERGQFHTSELKLAKRWGWSRKKVRSYLALLEKLKMGTTKGTTKGTTITIEKYNDYQKQGTAKGTTKGTLKEHQKNNEGYTNNNESIMTNNESINMFDKFWSEYPNKKAKKEAKKAWGKIKNPDMGMILSALKKQKQTSQWKKDNGQFIPMPSTWINQERWNDETKDEKPKATYIPPEAYGKEE